MFWDPTFVLLIPALVLAMWAQSRVRSTYAKMSRVRHGSGRTGREVARDILDRNGLEDVRIEEVGGRLSDHYDPRARVLRLSSENFRGQSVAACAVSAHEAGHALQHKAGYAALSLRQSMYPASRFGSGLAFPLFLIGLFMNAGVLMDVGIVLFTLAVLFTLVTLPVEFDASRRAYAELTTHGRSSMEEARGIKRMLDAAALTYVASATMAVLQLVRLLLLRGSRD